MYLQERCKIINAMPPHSTDAGLAGVCAYANLENWDHITIICQTGVGAPATVTVEKHTANSGAGTAIAFDYRICATAYNTAASDTLGTLTAAGVGGIAMSGTDNTYMVIEIDTATLTPTYPFIRAAFTAVAGVHSCIYILSDSRYQPPPTSVS